jgi:ATP-binding cassette subfamily F protein 3
MNHLNIHIDLFEINGEEIIGNIHTVINKDDRIAIVWPNGVGKSTFLKIISWEIEDFQWTLENIGSMSLGYLEQIHFMDESKSVREELKDAFFEIRKIEEIIRKEEVNLETTGEYEKYTEAIETYKTIGGYTYENEVEKVSRGIWIFHLLSRTLKEVSGWERTKIALAKTLLSKPDFLLLDEPTNFIDLWSVEWLEKYLQETWKWWYMIVSHDREFLDQTVTKIIEITWPKGIEIYVGDYSSSVQEKLHKRSLSIKDYDEQQTMLESEKLLINRFRAGSRAGFAKSREKMLDRVEILDKPIIPNEIHFIFDSPKEKPPETLVKLEDAFIGRKEPLFYIRAADLWPKERIGIVWENGVGKSTLIKTLLSSLPWDEREYIEWKKWWNHEISLSSIKILEWYLHIAKNIQIGYYSQMHESLDNNWTIEENFILHGFEYSKERIWGILKAYGFEYHDGKRKINGLSWWERSRLLFALLNQKSFHLLILDEPTNHLDYDTREALEKSLKSYEWAVLFISHDRYFVNKLATKLWIIEDGELIISYGNYEDYRYKKEKWISLDMSLFDVEWELNYVLEEKLWATEARRIREKFARKRNS